MTLAPMVDVSSIQWTLGLGAPDEIAYEEVHGNGAHLDDYETKDERQLIAGTGFTSQRIETRPARGRGAAGQLSLWGVQ